MAGMLKGYSNVDLQGFSTVDVTIFRPPIDAAVVGIGSGTRAARVSPRMHANKARFSLQGGSWVGVHIFQMAPTHFLQ